jgi:hypothetical protein
MSTTGHAGVAGEAMERESELVAASGRQTRVTGRHSGASLTEFSAG